MNTKPVFNPDPERLAWIPPGTFVMGSPESESQRVKEESQHEVTISRGFLIGKHEITQGEYQDVMGRNPSRFIGVDNPVETLQGRELQNSGDL